MEDNKTLICIKTNNISSTSMIHNSFKLYLELFQPAKKERISCTIEKNDNGKPFIKDFSGSISISHSGEFIVCAISNGLIGIDIEKRQKKTYNIIAKRFIGKSFCSNEEFLKYWVAAETVAKAEGINLLKSLRNSNCVKKVTYLNYFFDYYLCYYGNSPAYMIFDKEN